MEIKTVGIVGAGTMGNGIAQVFAASGYSVKLRDVGVAPLERGMGNIRKSLGKLVEKARLSQEDSDAALGRISTTTELADLADCDLVVEAIFENYDAKAAVFKELDGLLAPEAAVLYGHAAGETDTVAGLVDSLALALHYDGRMETLEEWLGWFGDDELRRYPALAVYGAWLRVLTGRQRVR